jgi:hypothetical protein
MEGLLVWIGRLAGLSGVLLCAFAMFVRFSGRFLLGGFQVTTLAQAGIAGMILGCLCFTAVITERLTSAR